MNGDQCSLRPPRRDDAAALAHHFHIASKSGTRGGAAKTDQNARLDERQFRLPPRSARSDLEAVRLLMKAAFAARLPLEVLHRVRHITLRTIHAGLRERAIEQAAGGTNERLAFAIFLVAWLFANQNH